MGRPTGSKLDPWTRLTCPLTHRTLTATHFPFLSPPHVSLSFFLFKQRSSSLCIFFFFFLFSFLSLLFFFLLKPMTDPSHGHTQPSISHFLPLILLPLYFFLLRSPLHLATTLAELTFTHGFPFTHFCLYFSLFLLSPTHGRSGRGGF